MARSCYAVRHLQKHARDVYGAFEEVVGGRHRLHVGLVGLLRGGFTSCMDRLCYVVGHQQNHASDVCRETEAKAGRRQGRPVGLVGVLRGRLMACMARPCYAVGILPKHASDVCGMNVRRRGNFSRSVYNSVWCGNGSAFGRVVSSRALVTANSRRRMNGARKAMCGQTL